MKYALCKRRHRPLRHQISPLTRAQAVPAAQPCLSLAPTPRRLYSELIYSCLSPAGDYSNDNGHDPKQIKNQWRGSPRLQQLRIRLHAASPASLSPPAAGSVPPHLRATRCAWLMGRRGPSWDKGGSCLEQQGLQQQGWKSPLLWGPAASSLPSIPLPPASVAGTVHELCLGAGDGNLSEGMVGLWLYCRALWSV